MSPPLFIVLAAGVLYWSGTRQLRRRTVESRARTAAFYGGLLTILVALDSPLDGLAGKLFAAHMAQHVLLLTVAPPLLLLGEPSLRLWHPLPLGFRRSVAKSVARGGWAAPLRRLGHLLVRPVAAFVLFTGVLVLWHIPALYDATLRNQSVHDLEHVLFVSTALLFWMHVVGSKPLRSKLDDLERAVYVTGALLVGWVLAIVIAFAPSPLYAPYASLPSRPGGLSALADQQLAAGIMWVPGSIAFTIAIVVSLYRWLEPAPSPRSNGRLRAAGSH
ncbi:MAG: cytochrome c oxidase assembly protein [Gaiellaceae bacterium]